MSGVGAVAVAACVSAVGSHGVRCISTVTAASSSTLTCATCLLSNSQPNLLSNHPCLQSNRGGMFGYGNAANSRGSFADLIGACSLSRERRIDRNSALEVHAVVKRSPKRLKYSESGVRKGANVVYVQVDPLGSDVWKLDSIVELIKGGAVGVIPTDTVYAIVCDLKNRESIDRLYRIKDMDSKKPLSILCRSFQDIDTYTMGFPRGNSQGQTNVFRAARQCLPGPYTFILPASKEMPKQCTTFGGSAAVSCAPRKSVGVRMPNDVICQAILERLEDPLLCTSVRQPAADQWMLDPVIISDTYGAIDGKQGLDFVVDGGVRMADPSTVVDMTGIKPVVLRTGKGIVEEWMLMEGHDSTELLVVGGLENPYAQ